MSQQSEIRYQLKQLGDSNIALFHWVGPITLDDRRRNMTRMAQFCQANQLKNLLIDGRDQISRTDTYESFDVGKEVPEQLRGLKIAVVHRSDDDSLPFIETVASNRGAVTKAFLSIDAARAWLESCDETRSGLC